MDEVCNIDTGKCFKDGEWIPLDELGGKLETGDLVETPTRLPKNYPLIGGVVVPLINHYGIYLEIDGKPMVAHNPFGGYPEIISLAQFEGNRKIDRVIRTGMSADYIIKKTNECKDKPYNFFGTNCEEFINYVCGCTNGELDQRVGWVLFIIIIILLILALRKN